MSDLFLPYSLPLAALAGLPLFFYGLVFLSIITGFILMYARRLILNPPPPRKAPPPVRRVAVAVIRRGETFLVQRRRDDAHEGGKWEFPGGGIEAGESPEEAAARECREELGCEVEVEEELGIVEHVYSDRVVELNAVLCSLGDGPKPAPAEDSEIRWMTIRNLRDTEIPEANHALLDLIESQLLEPVGAGADED